MPSKIISQRKEERDSTEIGSSLKFDDNYEVIITLPANSVMKQAFINLREAKLEEWIAKKTMRPLSVVSILI